MKKLACVVAVTLLCGAGAFAACAQEPMVDVAVTDASFGRLADDALAAMRAEAVGRKVGGVAVVAYFAGTTVQAWTSKMLVVGHVKDEPKGADKGSNLLAIVYAKAAEMADTLKNSGSKVRPPMTGEFGWEGGVIVQVKGGYLIAAFSGGPSSDDVAIARVGLRRMTGELKGPQEVQHP